MVINQEALSNALGFADRQTLASIEAGQRAVAPAELVAIAQALGTTVADLLDPYRLAEREAAFNFRTAEPVTGDVFRAFEDTAGRWIATYREVGLRLGEPHRSARTVRVAMSGHNTVCLSERLE